MLNERKAKQRRRMVAFADAGDPAAQTWCMKNVMANSKDPASKFRRILRRMISAEYRRRMAKHGEVSKP